MEDAHRFLDLVTGVGDTFVISLLEMLTIPFLIQSHGLSRIETILSFPSVVAQVQNRRDVVSFAFTYIGCLAV